METWNNGNWPKMATVFPDGASKGTASIKHVTVSEQDEMFSALRSMMGRRGYVKAGDTYAQLFVGGCLWMSDTFDERSDHREVLWNARGHVLIGGLGLGLVALACALKDRVESVTVVEINPDVIALVEPHLRRTLETQGMDPNKLKVICADIYEWKPENGTLYDCIWFDVWSVLCTDNLKLYSKLNRRFARCWAPDGWRGAWGEGLLKRRRRQEKERYTY